MRRESSGAGHPVLREIAAWSPQEFIDRVLVGALHAKAVVVGANFRFGNRAAGDRQTLREAGAEQDFVLEAVELDGGPQVWSSTYIRTCLAAGDVAGAAEALGRPFVTRGVVIEGDKRGRGLGFPTANVPVLPGAAAPADGVYAGWLRRLDGADGGVRHPTAISVGTNPTFDGLRDRRVEGYVLDRTDLDLYGVEVEVEFIERIRGMVRSTASTRCLSQSPTMSSGLARSSAHDGVGRGPGASSGGGVVRPPRPAVVRRRHP